MWCVWVCTDHQSIPHSILGRRVSCLTVATQQSSPPIPPTHPEREREGGGGGGGGTARDSRDHRLPRGSVIRLRERRDGATGELYHLPFPAEKRQFGASLLYPASHNTH